MIRMYVVDFLQIEFALNIWYKNQISFEKEIILVFKTYS